MGSSLSAIYDDVEYYEDFCKFLKIKEKDKWYDHFHQIIKDNGNDGKYNVYRRLKERYENRSKI